MPTVIPLHQIHGRWGTTWVFCSKNCMGLPLWDITATRANTYWCLQLSRTIWFMWDGSICCLPGHRIVHYDRIMRWLYCNPGQGLLRSWDPSLLLMSYLKTPSHRSTVFWILLLHPSPSVYWITFPSATLILICPALSHPIFHPRSGLGPHWQTSFYPARLHRPSCTHCLADLDLFPRSLLAPVSPRHNPVSAISYPVWLPPFCFPWRL